jgi:hypothetical protein
VLLLAHLNGAPVLALSTNSCQVALEDCHFDTLLDESDSKHQPTNTSTSNENLEGPRLGAYSSARLGCLACNQG